METPLTCMYLMPDTQEASNNADSQSLVETWKGPWSEIRKVTDLKDSSVFGVKLLPGTVRPNDLNGSTYWKAEFQAPDASVLDKEVDWVIQDVQANEIVAGELGQVKIRYSGVPKDSGGEDDFAKIRPETWSLHWGSYTRSPLEYCRNDTGGRAEEVIACLEKPHPTAAELEANGWQSTEENLKYVWWKGTDDIYRTFGKLTDMPTNSGQKIYDYCQREIKPIFHYPIVERHQTLKQIPDPNQSGPKQVQDVEKIDYKASSLPQGCPFSDLSGWEWLCVDDSYDGFYDGSYGYTRTTTWWGAKKVDDNFYGADGTRWEVPQ